MEQLSQIDYSQIFSILFFVGFIFNIFLAFVIIFFERRQAGSTWAWLLVLFFLPIVGFILYLLFGRQINHQTIFTLNDEDRLDLERIVSAQRTAIDNGNIEVRSGEIIKHSHIIRMLLHNYASFLTTDNKVEILTDGRKKFDALLNDIHNATDHIHIQYYIFNDDNLGTEILNLLVKKAKEGIEVKLLYDGMGCIHNKKHFFDPLVKAGGEVYCFFPPFIPYINVRINYRNHRKICVVDGEHGFVGGLNVGDEYLGLSKKFGFWRDTHLHLQGDSVNYLEVRFLMDWRFASKKDFFMEERYFPRKPYIDNTAVQIISSGPDSEWCSIRNTYLKLISKAENSIYIETPYFIPDESILTALKIACLSGVDVKIIIPCKPDHPFIYWASKSYIWELVECGAKCYTYDNGFIHSKMVSIDGKMCTIGTANMDIRSFNLNFEVNAIIYGTITTSEVDKAFESDILQSTLLTPEHYSNRSLIIKFKEAISRLLSPIL
ncbi:cardiolipin synthase [Clostridium sp. UBA3887]|uniref:cardiolipin synthase n=1 Tax=Clostridium sp. UBA3887 TaxID=1946356 RepID=UPI003216AFA2